MHKKICMCSITFFISCVAMEQESNLRRELYKGAISALAVNDYIVNVSNAYQALLKEASLEHSMLPRKIKEINKQARARMQEKECLLYRLFDKKTIPRLVNKELFYVNKVPYFRCFTITCKNMSENKNIYRVDVCISTICYYLSPLTADMKTRNYSLKGLQNPIILHSNNFDDVIPQGKMACIELYCPGHISDWIRIEHCSDKIDNGMFNFNLTDLAVRLGLWQEDLKLSHQRDADYNPIDRLGITIAFYSLIFGITVITAAYLC
jgi:hypothetical protein